MTADFDPSPSPPVVVAAEVDSQKAAREAARADFRKQARARVCKRGGFVMIGLIAIIAALSGIVVVANQHEAEVEASGLQFVIPDGASAAIDVPTIDSAIVIPTVINFREGEDAVLSIRNDDQVANRAGPWVIGPGQTYTAKFDKPGTYEYVCSVDAAESVTIIVEGKE